jgi:glycosyltransferase involved in cell wall biosynthesis
MAQGDVILNISNFEGMPQTVLEGASLGLWPLVSRIESGHSEIIERLGFGTLCPLGDNNAFVQELLRLGSELNNLRARRALIREQTLRHFPLPACLSRYRELAGLLSRARISRPSVAPYRPDLRERLARPFLLAKYLRHVH